MTNNNSHILLVDDEPDILELLTITLSRLGHSAVCAENITKAKEQLQSYAFAVQPYELG